MDIELVSPHQGSVSFFIGDDGGLKGQGTPEGTIDASTIGDGLLRRMVENLIAGGTDHASIFGSVLKSEGTPTLEDIEISTFRDGGSVGIWLGSEFHYGQEGSGREYGYLPFLEPFHLPKYDPANWSAMRDYEAAVKDFSRVVVDVRIEANGPMNLDIQGDGTDHERHLEGESVRLTPTFSDFTLQGHEFTVSDGPFFRPVSAFAFTAIVTISGLALTVLAIVRRRFRSWAWVFPGVYAILAPMPAWFYIRPYMNPYGLMDAGLWSIGLVCIAYSISLHFLPNGERKGAVHEGPPMHWLPEFEMPSVIYVDRPVIVREKARPIDGSDQDPYAVLGVGKDADPKEVEKAYRSMILKYHPDKVGSGPDWVREEAARKTDSVVKAYERVRSGR
jgi:hypothetical protein